jgi:uncharacterized protein (DUF2384 family)
VPSDPKEWTSFEFPVANRVDASTKAGIRRIAVGRWYRSIDYPSLPLELRGLAHSDAEKVIKDAYSQIGSETGIERDALAMAVTRFIQLSRLPPASRCIDEILDPMIKRANSNEQGGRSHSLTAMLALLLRSDERHLPTDVRPELATVAEFAVTSDTFVHPEFGLLIAAKLAEEDPRSYLESFLDLLGRATEMRQTHRFKAVVQMLATWQPRRERLRRILQSHDINKALMRLTDPSVDVINRQEQAASAIERAIDQGSARMTREELILIDHWTRYRADQVLQHDLGRVLLSRG